MCGIAGYIDFRNLPEEATLRSMERVLTHRGPDEGKIWKDGPCRLVHRRLRIIDLSPAAAQPMSNEDEHLWAVFNGEIYNYRPLRARCGRNCWRWATGSGAGAIPRSFCTGTKIGALICS